MKEQAENSVQVSDIMEEIRAEIKEKGYTGDMLSFADVPMESEEGESAERFDTDLLRSSVQYYNAHHNVALDRPLTGNPVTVALKKLVRKCTRFYAEPYVREQNGLNACTSQFQTQMEMYVQESRAHNNKALLERIETLELQQKNTRLEMDKMQNQIRALQEKLDQMEDKDV